jgi:hypothetical protein
MITKGLRVHSLYTHRPSQWERTFVLTPNNYDFPAGTIPVPAPPAPLAPLAVTAAATAASEGGIAGGGATAAAAEAAAGAGLPFDDLRAFYTAIYASPAGQLISFFPATPGMSQTSLHSPSNGYAGLVNFFGTKHTVSFLPVSVQKLLAEHNGLPRQARDEQKETVISVQGLHVDGWLFADPDNFFTVSALALSGDPYLLVRGNKTKTSLCLLRRHL